VVVVGEAGLGKTALVRELQRERSYECQWVEGACLPEAGIPFLPFHDALSGYFQLASDETSETRTRKLTERLKGAAPELLQLIPVVGSMLGAGASLYREHMRLKAEESGHVEADPRMERERRFEAMSGFLSGMARPEAPLVFFIDDLQWADPTSLAFFHYFARRIRDRPVLLVATIRTEESERGAGEALQLMSRENLLERIVLKPLRPDEVGRIASAELAGPVDPAFQEHLSQGTDGNPLFAIETLRLLRAEGAFETSERGLYRLKPGERVRLPEKVQDVLARRCQRLNRDERASLDCAAVVGANFDPVLVASVVTQDSIVVLQRFEEISRTHKLLVPSGTEAFSFAHGSIREYLQAALSPVLRKQYHLRIAQILEKKGIDSDEQVGLIAFHAVSAKDPEMGARWATEAARRAKAKYANEEAIRSYRAALELTPEGETRALIEEEAGDLAAITGDYHQSERLYRRSMNWPGGDGQRRGRCLIKIVEMWTQLGKMREAHKAFEEMDELLPKMEPAIRARGLGVKNHYLLTLGEDVKAAVDATGEALELLTKLDAPKAEVLKTYVRHASTLNYAGRFREAMAATERARDLLHEVQDTSSQMRAHLNLGMAFAGLGKLSNAEAALRQGLEVAEKSGNPLYIDLLARELGFVRLDLGDLSGAKKCLERVEYAQRKQELADIGEIEAVRGRIALFEGKALEAAEAFERGLAADRADSEYIFVPRFCADLAQARLALGELTGAETSAREAIQLGRHHLHIVPRARRVLGAVAARRGDQEEALRQFEMALTAFSGLEMPGEVGRTLVEKAQSLSEPERKAMLESALTTFEAHGYAPDAAKTRELLQSKGPG
jgi:tetratricopeptide (TPR) repeat protein